MRTPGRPAPPARPRARARRRPRARLPRRADDRLRPCGRDGRRGTPSGTCALWERASSRRRTTWRRPSASPTAWQSCAAVRSSAPARPGPALRARLRRDPLPPERQRGRPRHRAADPRPPRAHGPGARGRRRARGSGSIGESRGRLPRAHPRGDRGGSSSTSSAHNSFCSGGTERRFFSFLFPILLLVLIGSVYGDEPIEGVGASTFLLIGLSVTGCPRTVRGARHHARHPSGGRPPQARARNPLSREPTWPP